MPRKMKELLDGWGICADKHGFEHAGVSRDRKYRGVAVKKEVYRVGDGGRTRGGSCFLLPYGGWFSH